MLPCDLSILTGLPVTAINIDVGFIDVGSRGIRMVETWVRGSGQKLQSIGLYFQWQDVGDERLLAALREVNPPWVSLDLWVDMGGVNRHAYTLTGLTQLTSLRIKATSLSHSTVGQLSALSNLAHLSLMAEKGFKEGAGEEAACENGMQTCMQSLAAGLSQLTELVLLPSDAALAAEAAFGSRVATVTAAPYLSECRGSLRGDPRTLFRKSSGWRVEALDGMQYCRLLCRAGSAAAVREAGGEAGPGGSC